MKKLIIFFGAAMSVALPCVVSAQTVTIDQKGISIEEAFAQIEQQTAHNIAYERSTLDAKQRIDLSLREATLDKTMAEVLRPTGLSYTVSGYHIILVPRQPQSVRAAASPMGRVRGTVVDGASGQPLPYVTVMVPGVSAATVTDAAGAFSLPPLVVGRHNIQATFLGYEPATLREVMVSSAKETVLQISMIESVQTIETLIVRPKTNKEEPLNAMALTGARMLSVEEASRYAGGMDDPARLVTAFAGTAGSVTGNGIAIRGNSPQSMQWKLEGVEIPNPNHFPEITSVGGGMMTAFSSQVLGNSDFYTGAFPAQYNNALSGVFDMALRNGNNQRYEHTAQLGTLGLEFASEGPFEKGKGSYLFNYRYSAMALMADIMGGDMDEVQGLRYQDLSLKVNLPTRRWGTFTIWGIGAVDHYGDTLPDDPTNYEYELNVSYSRQKMGAAGIGHHIFIAPNAYLKTTLAATFAQNHIWSDVFDDNGENPLRNLDMLDKHTSLIFNTFINTKFSARHTNRTGITVTGLFYDDNYNIAHGAYPTRPMENFVDTAGRSTSVTVFSQSMFQLNERLTGEVGVNGQLFALNNHFTVEPRASLRWKVAPRHSLGLAAGMHSRLEKLDYYFVTTPETGERPVNKDLDFSKALHLTMGYDWHIADDLHLRVEPYFQHLYNVPVVPGTARSIINHDQFYMDEPLVNDGKGRNLGVDITLERYLRRGFYYMLTASIFDSKFTGDDGKWRSTMYDRDFLINALAGKEWMLGRGKQHVLGVSVRVNSMGGNHYTPLDMEASLAARESVEDESRTMEGQYPSTLAVHVNINWQIHRHKVTHELGVKMLNATGSKEHYGFTYNRLTHRMDKSTATVSLPNIYYRVSF